VTFTPEIAVFDPVTGAIAYVTTKANSPASSNTKLASVVLPKGYSEATWDWNATTRTFVENAAKVEAVLIATVKDEAEQRKMMMATPGGMKKAEYAEKRAEVLAWKALGASVGSILAAFNLLPMATRQTRFAHALDDSAEFGDTPADAIARFEAGMTQAAPTTRISAREARTCAKIRAATTIAGKRAAAASLVWPT